MKLLLVLADDIGHLEGWPVHRFCSFRESLTLSGLETSIVSRGFATAVKCLPRKMQIDDRVFKSCDDRAAPGWCADPRRLRAGAWRNCAAACVARYALVIPARFAACWQASQGTLVVTGMSARQFFTVPGNR